MKAAIPSRNSRPARKRTTFVAGALGRKPISGRTALTRRWFLHAVSLQGRDTATAPFVVTLVVDMPITWLDALEVIAFVSDGAVENAGTAHPRCLSARTRGQKC